MNALTDSAIYIRTAQAGTKEWLETSKNMVIVAYDTGFAQPMVPEFTESEIRSLLPTRSRDRYRDPDPLI